MNASRWADEAWVHVWENRRLKKEFIMSDDIYVYGSDCAEKCNFTKMLTLFGDFTFQTLSSFCYCFSKRLKQCSYYDLFKTGWVFRSTITCVSFFSIANLVESQEKPLVNQRGTPCGFSVHCTNLHLWGFLKAVSHSHYTHFDILYGWKLVIGEYT